MEINVQGDGFRLTLDVGGYESERQGRDSHDDNWLTGTVALEIARPPAATFKASCTAAWQTTDFVSFHEALRCLLENLTGVATFSTIEDQVRLTIRLDNGKGTVEGRVEEHALATLEFEGETDQSFLAATLSEVRAVISRYPFRQ